MNWTTLYTLDAVCIVIAIVSYYFGCYRKGYRIDIWQTQLLFVCVIPNMVMLPFAGGTLNAVVLGSDYRAVVAALPMIFLVSAVGFFSVLVGGSFWRLHLGIGVRRAAAGLVDVVPRLAMGMMSSRSVLLFQAGLCLVLQAALLSFYFAKSGFGFDLRQFTFANPAIRPIASGLSSYAILLGSHCLARYVECKERSLLVCTLLLSFGLVFFGARSSIVTIYFNVILCYLVGRGSRVRLLRTLGFAFFGLVTLFYLGSVREGHYSISDFLGSLVFLAFYGNNFSDLRDFAWVYADWDHHFWTGKTYVAGITAFVPRFVSHFRDTWGLGVATGTVIGVDTDVHPGLRPGAFGEGYFNFSWLGVIVVGILIGIIVKHVDSEVKVAMKGPNPSMMKAFAATMALQVSGCIALSPNFSALYVLGFVYLFAWFLRKTLALVSSPASIPKYISG